MLAWARTPSGATRKGVLKLEATFYGCEKHISTLASGSRRSPDLG